MVHITYQDKIDEKIKQNKEKLFNIIDKEVKKITLENKGNTFKFNSRKLDNYTNIYCKENGVIANLEYFNYSPNKISLWRKSILEKNSCFNEENYNAIFNSMKNLAKILEKEFERDIEIRID